MGQPRYQIVFMTSGNRGEAERIAETLVERDLAACVNIVECCRSIYRWEGKIVKDDEVMMFAKTSRGQFDAIVKTVTDLHSYDVPEIIAADLDSLSQGYRDFLRNVLGD